jgi:DNA-binding response OmpR family regulator
LLMKPFRLTEVLARLAAMTGRSCGSPS